MLDRRSNPFQRYAYSGLDSSLKGVQIDQGIFPETFSGGDLQAFINNKKVANLESVTWSISVEVVGNYVMGQRNPLSYTKGKRVIVGSLALTQWDRHALLEQVFHLSRSEIFNQYDIWSALGGSPAQQVLNTTDFTIVGTNRAVNSASVSTELNPPGASTGIGANNANVRGLSRVAYENELRQMVKETAALIGAQKIDNSDQLPPFDLTLVGVNQGGAAAYCTLFGMTITQETAGFSMNDLANTVGMSFTALYVSPWRPVLDNAGELLRDRPTTG
jgi:hypothetical protein